MDVTVNYIPLITVMSLYSSCSCLPSRRYIPQIYQQTPTTAVMRTGYHNCTGTKGNNSLTVYLKRVY